MSVPVGGLEAPFHQPALVTRGEGHHCFIAVTQLLPESHDLPGLPLSDKRVMAQLHEGHGQGHDAVVAGPAVRSEDALKQSTTNTSRYTFGHAATAVSRACTHVVLPLSLLHLHPRAGVAAVAAAAVVPGWRRVVGS